MRKYGTTDPPDENDKVHHGPPSGNNAVPGVRMRPKLVESLGASSMSSRAYATEVMERLRRGGVLSAYYTNEFYTVQDIITEVFERAMDQARFNPAPYKTSVE